MVNDYKDTSVYDVNILLGFEMAKASARLCPRGILASGQDVFVTAPGLPLTFGRVAPQSIPNRFMLGPLGRGWYHTYEYSGSTNEDGDIIIKGPGGSARMFILQNNGTYVPMPGDYARIAVVTGEYVITEKNGITWRFDESTGELLSIEDTRSNTLSFSYSSDGLTQISHSNGDSITINYNSSGMIEQVTSPVGVVNYTYAGGEHLETVEYSGEIITSYSYNGTGTPSAHAINTITYPDSTHYYYAYDDKGRLSEEWPDGNSGHITYTYDELGTVTVTDSLNNTTLIRYGAKGEVLETKDPNGILVKFSYDESNQISQIIGPNDKTSSIAYDENGNPTGTINPENQIVKTSFDNDLGRLTKLTDAKNNSLEYSYDIHGSLETIKYPDDTTENFTYYSNGALQSYTNRRMQTVDYKVNSKGQIIQKIYQSGRTFDYEYDTKGNLVVAKDTLTGATTMQYDDRNFITRIEYPGGYWFEFEYTNTGKRTKRTDQNGDVINYEYDLAGRLKKLSDASNSTIITYNYDENGRLEEEIKGNGTRTTYSYDPAGQLLAMINYAPDNSVQSSFKYEYDDNGRRTSMTTLEGTTLYEYDNIGQLTQVTYPDTCVVSYEYDSCGNRISVTDNGITTDYTTNNMNQYTQVGDTAYTYDDDGNMISKTDIEGTTTYEYDTENRLIRVENTATGDVWQYTYDALGNRISVTENGVLKRYVHDPAGLVDVAAEYDSTGALITQYTHGVGLVNQTDNSSNISYYAFDGTGHTRQLTDSSGAVVNTYDYTPFGISLQANETVPNPFQYVGKYGVMEESHDLTYMRARYFSANVGRFVSQDPINILAGDTNLYTYCGSDSINSIDASGLINELQEFIEECAIYKFQMRQFEIERIMHHRFAIRLYGKGIRIYNFIFRNKTYLTGSGFYYSKYLAAYSGKAFVQFVPYIKGLGILSLQGLGVGLAGIAGYAFGYLITTWLPYEYNYWAKLVEWHTYWTTRLWKKVKKALSTIFVALDPNEKTGPVGVGTEQYVVSGQEMSYTVYFENKAEATAPAQEVFVHDYLDSDLDWGTFKLGEVAFGDKVITSMSGRMHGTDMVMHEDLAVEITCGYDAKQGYAVWSLRSLDPETGELPEDALAGFLPPEDGTGRGQGYVSFTITAKDDLVSGTTIVNKARIYFDTEAPIETNVWINIVTDAAPGAPANPVPEDGAVDVPTSTVLHWDDVEFANYYDLYLWESGTKKPSEPTADGILNPSYDVNWWIHHNANYAWQVVAGNVMGETESPVWSFTTEPKPNEAPTVHDVSATTDEDTSVSITLLGDDPDNDPLTYEVDTPPAHGTVTIAGDLAIYSPELDYYGTDSFAYKAYDGTVWSETSATVNITISPVNDPPVLDLIPTMSLDEGSAFEYQLTASDVDDTGLIFFMTGGQIGSMMGPFGKFSWTPDYGQAGVYQFTMGVRDPHGAEDTQIVTLTVNNVNRPPVADAGGPYIGETGAGLTLDASGSYDLDEPYGDRITRYEWDLDGDGANDVEGETYNLTWDEITSHGLDGGHENTITLRVVDTGNAWDRDTSTLQVFDNEPIAVADATPINARPWDTVQFDGSSSYQRHPQHFIVTYEWDFDYDGVNFTTDDTTVSPTHNYPLIGTYTAALRVTDDNIPAKTDIDTIVITVSITNHNPIADANGPYTYVVGVDSNGLVLDGSGSYDHDEVYGDYIKSYKWDLDYDGQTFSPDATGVNVLLTHAYLTGLDSLVTKSIMMEVEDSLGGTNTNVTTLTVYENRPVAVAQADKTQTGQEEPINFDGSESYHLWPTERSIVQWEWDFNYDGVTLDVEADGVQVQHAFNVLDMQTIALRVTDDEGLTDITTIDIHIAFVNHPPVADSGGPYEIDGGQDLVLDASASYDSDVPYGDSIVNYEWDFPGYILHNFTVPSATIPWNDLIPFPRGIPIDIQLRVTDSHGEISIDPTTLIIHNHPPVAQDLTIETDEDTAVEIQLIAEDLDNDTLTFKVIDNVIHEILNVDYETGILTYTPDENFNGTDSFTYQANDGPEDSNIATVSITVNPVNDAPIFEPIIEPASCNEGELLTFTIHATDIDNDTINYSMQGGPLGAIMGGLSGTFEWTPTFDQAGVYDVTFIADDGNGGTDEMVTTIVVNNVNRLPVADAGPDQTVEATSPDGAQVTLNGTGSSDPDEDTLTYEWTGPFGTVTGVTPLIQVPLGTHTITLTVSDGIDSVTDTVDITIQDIVPPVITIQNVLDNTIYNFNLQPYVIVTDNIQVASWAAFLNGSPFFNGDLVTADAVHTLTVNAIDTAGNKATKTITFTLDKTPPTGSILINNGDFYTNSFNAVLTLSATDQLVGVTGMRFGYSSNSFGQTLPFATTHQFRLMRTTPDTASVFVQFVDGAGNASPAYNDTIYLDFNAPTGSLSINNGDTYVDTTTVTLSFSAQDNSYHSPTVKVSNDKITWTTFNILLPVQWQVVPGDGTRTVYAHYIDRAGNISNEVSDSIILDTTWPTLQVPPDVTAEATGRMTYVDIGPGSSGDTTPMKLENDAPLDRMFPFGVTIVNWKVTDSVGHVTTDTQKVTVVDTIPPSGTVDINNGDEYTNNPDVMLFIEASDAVGVAQVEFSFDGEIWSEPLPFEEQVPVHLEGEDGTKTVMIRLRDEAGNTSAPIIDTIILDTTTEPPQQVVEVKVKIRPRRLLLTKRSRVKVFIKVPKMYSAGSVMDPITCDGAKSIRKIVLKRRNMLICTFMTKDMTELPIDKHFTITGTLEHEGKTITFQGEDSIRRIITLKKLKKRFSKWFRR